MSNASHKTVVFNSEAPRVVEGTRESFQGTPLEEDQAYYDEVRAMHFSIEISGQACNAQPSENRDTTNLWSAGSFIVRQPKHRICQPVAEGFVVLELFKQLSVVLEKRSDDALKSLIVFDAGVLPIRVLLGILIRSIG